MKFNFKKKYGQNFLIDKNIVKKIVNLGENEDFNVLEIGCGDGKLTKELCQKYKYVLGYEIDKELIPILIDNLKKYDNCEIIFEDFLKRDINKDIEDSSLNDLYIFGNLPYYITTPIIEKIIESNVAVTKMIFMVQKEVGERFSAKVGSKEYSSLTVYLNYYFSIKKEFEVSRNCFMPKPNVDSVIVSMTKKEELIPLKDKDLFFKVVRDSFKYKRKTLRNNLKDYNLERIEEVLNKHNLDLTVRAEQLSLELFCEIANNL